MKRKITTKRINEYLNFKNSNHFFNTYDTEFSIHRTLYINDEKVLGICMETGKPLSRYKGYTHIWIRDLKKPINNQCTDIFRGYDYDELLKINIKDLINNERQKTINNKIYYAWNTNNRIPKEDKDFHNNIPTLDINKEYIFEFGSPYHPYRKIKTTPILALGLAGNYESNLKYNDKLIVSPLGIEHEENLFSIIKLIGEKEFKIPSINKEDERIIWYDKKTNEEDFDYQL